MTRYFRCEIRFRRCRRAGIAPPRAMKCRRSTGVHTTSPGRSPRRPLKADTSPPVFTDAGIIPPPWSLLSDAAGGLVAIRPRWSRSVPGLQHIARATTDAVMATTFQATGRRVYCCPDQPRSSDTGMTPVEDLHWEEAHDAALFVASLKPQPRVVPVAPHGPDPCAQEVELSPRRPWARAQVPTKGTPALRYPTCHDLAMRVLEGRPFSPFQPPRERGPRSSRVPRPPDPAVPTPTPRT
jgi:hypothetical protein